MRSPDPRALLSDSRWLQRLLRQFVNDADLVEDLCQETVATALQHPSNATRPWLARVARNLALSFLRGETRRRRLEGRIPAPGQSNATVDVVAEAELQRGAVDALLGLEEPYCTTLLLRFMKGLSLREVAKRMGVPVETVRTRQKRGLARLRVRLDSRPGGRLALILPLALPGWPTPTTASLWGFILMKTKLGIASAAAVVFAALLSTVWILASQTEATDTLDTDGGSLAANATPGPGKRIIAAETQEREVLPPELSPSPVSNSGAVLVVRLRWQDNGQPAQYVGVRIRDQGRQIPRMAITGDDGLARFSGLTPGPVAVDLQRFVEKRITVKTGEVVTLDLTIPEGRDVHGLVVDAGNHPVPDAEVLCVQGGTRPQWSQALIRTDADGRFLLRSMHFYNVLGARAPGQATSDFLLVMTCGRRQDGSTEMRLQLPGPEAILRGFVLRPDGNPAVSAYVKVGQDCKLLGSAQRRSPPFRHVRTNSRGEFVVSHLQAGAIQVRVYCSDLPPWSSTFECRHDTTTEARILLEPGAVIHGCVTDKDGQPLSGVTLEIEEVDHPGHCSAVSDAQGRYRLERVPGGTVTVSMEKRGLGYREERLQVPVGKSVLLDLIFDPGLIIYGRLVDERQQPLVGWVIRGGKRLHQTDAQGRFAIPNCEDRDYQLAVLEGYGFGPAIQIIEGVRPGAAKRTWRILDSQRPSAVIRGRVFSADYRALGGVPLDLVQVPGNLLIPLSNSDAEGRFETRRLPPGRYSLRMGHPNHRFWKSEILELTASQEKDLGDIVLQRK